MTMHIEVKSQLFKGIAMPTLFDSKGNIALMQDNDLVRHELIYWLITGITETFMDFNDGVGLDDQLFDPGDETTFTVLQSMIKDRLDQLEQRVEIKDVKIKQSDEPGDESKIIAVIIYKIPALVDQSAEDTYSLQVGIGTVI